MELRAYEKKFFCGDIREDAEEYLYCFPETGAWPSMFERFSEKLDRRVCIVPFCFPGKGERHDEKPFDDIETMAKNAAYIIGKHSEGRRYSLFGDGMGAVCAVRIAQIMKEQYDRAPVKLFICGFDSIIDTSKKSLSSLTDEELIAYMRGIAGQPPCVKRFINDDQTVHFFIDVMRADLRAAETFEFRDAPRLESDFVLLKSSSDKSGHPDILRKLTSGDISEKSFECEKMLLFDEKLTGSISSFINSVLICGEGV